MFFLISIILSLQPQPGYASQLTALTTAQIDYRQLPLVERMNARHSLENLTTQTIDIIPAL